MKHYVKITGYSSECKWYKNMVGCIVEVTKENPDYCEETKTYEYKTSEEKPVSISFNDCENVKLRDIASETHAEIVLRNNKRYIVVNGRLISQSGIPSDLNISNLYTYDEELNMIDDAFLEENRYVYDVMKIYFHNKLIWERK